MNFVSFLVFVVLQILFVPLAIFGVVKATMGLRVTPEEEMEGLDIGEHGMPAYADFQTVSAIGGHAVAKSAMDPEGAYAAELKFKEANS